MHQDASGEMLPLCRAQGACVCGSAARPAHHAVIWSLGTILTSVGQRQSPGHRCHGGTEHRAGTWTKLRGVCDPGDKAGLLSSLCKSGILREMDPSSPAICTDAPCLGCRMQQQRLLPAPPHPQPMGRLGCSLPLSLKVPFSWENLHRGAGSRGHLPPAPSAEGFRVGKSQGSYSLSSLHPSQEPRAFLLLPGFAGDCKSSKLVQQ